MNDADLLRAEIAQNFDALQRKLGNCLPEHAGRFALLVKREIKGFFDDPIVADNEGKRIASDGLYSIQQVTDRPVELGVYANAIH